jgi:uncharacterized protein
MPTCKAVIVKIASRCNLNCSYCYVYNMGDSSYKKQPALMSAEVAAALIGRAAEHCSFHKLDHFEFVFHGGEPLLAPSRLIEKFVEMAKQRFKTVCDVSFAIQTNGILLTPNICRVLKELDFRVGVSIDGTRDAHDARRVYHDGRGSYSDVLHGWRTAVSEGLDPGILTVVDIGTGPRELFKTLEHLKPRVVDLLLPDSNHDSKPRSSGHGATDTPYADWLIEVFDEWISKSELPFRIKLFESIICSILGNGSGSDSLGSALNEILVIETDGQIGPTDVLKICAEGCPEIDLNVKYSSFDAAMTHPMIELYHYSHQKLCETCRSCAIKDVCGGGYLPHRYKQGHGFDNPSVYCPDLFKLIRRIESWVLDNLPIIASPEGPDPAELGLHQMDKQL